MKYIAWKNHMTQITKNGQHKMSWTNSVCYFASTSPEHRCLKKWDWSFIRSGVSDHTFGQWIWGRIALGKSLPWVKRNFLKLQVWWDIDELCEQICWEYISFKVALLDVFRNFTELFYRFTIGWTKIFETLPLFKRVLSMITHNIVYDNTYQ